MLPFPLECYWRFPAVGNAYDGVYFIKNDQIVCEGMVGCRYEDEITIYLCSDQALAHFENDFGVKVLGKNAPFRFYRFTGEPGAAFTDEPEDRLEGYTVVDKMEFDIGLADRLRYGHIPGFGKLINKS